MSLFKNRKPFFLFCIIILSPAVYGQESIKELYELSAKQFEKGKYDDALISNIKALKIAEKNNNCSELAYALLQVGVMEYYITNKRRALNYCLKSLKILESCKIDTLLEVIYGDMGGIYTELGKNDSALLYLIKSKEILEKSKNYGSLSKVNAVLADLYLWNFNNLTEGEKYLIEAEKFAELSKSKKWKAFALMKRGIFYKMQQKIDKSSEAFKTALKYYEELGIVEGRSYALGMIIGNILLTSNPETKNLLGQYLTLKDSIYNAEMANKIADYKTIYETEKKESENKLLQQKNKLNQTELDAKNRTIIGLIIGVLLIIISAFWRISVIHLKKKNRELEATKAVQKEKERISRDLHDNVGGQLSYVLYSLDGMNDKNEQKRLELSSNINESIRNVIGNLRETIWAINDEFITINDFSDKLKVYVRTMFRNTETNIIFDENISHNMHLNSVAGLNLYRICQEIMNNAFKHSKATELKVEIHVEDKTKIIISDNGIGFDIKKQSDQGYGLANMKHRAVEVGISLDLISEIHKGTTYILVV